MSATADSLPGAADGALAGARLAGAAARWSRVLWVAPIGLALLVTTVYPTIFLLALAGTKSTLGKPFAKFVGFKNVLAATGDPIFLASVGKSLAYGLATSAVQLAVGLAVALLFTSLLKAGRVLVSLVLLPLMTPPVMVGIAWKLILAPAGGWLNGVLLDLGVVDAPLSFLGTPVLAWISIAVADLWQWTPFVVILCFAALATLPEGVREAAIVDGAGPVQAFRHVTLPLIAAPLASIFLLKLILSFKLFDLVYILTFGGPGFTTTTAGFGIYRLAMNEFDVGKAAAETLIYAVVVGLVTLPVVKLHRRLEEHHG